METKYIFLSPNAYSHVRKLLPGWDDRWKQDDRNGGWYIPLSEEDVRAIKDLCISAGLTAAGPYSDCPI